MTEERASQNRKRATKPGSSGNSRTRIRPDYAAVLDEVEQFDFELLSGIEGIDDEITLLRLKVRQLLAQDPDNVRLIVATVTTLARLVKMRYSMTDRQENKLREALRSVYRNIVIPIGISAGSEFVKRLLR